MEAGLEMLCSAAAREIVPLAACLAPLFQVFWPNSLRKVPLARAVHVRWWQLTFLENHSGVRQK
eukprot:CAMPEP_0194512360 /NCGR_PEP_ID=MMETSP0253-20130528/44335_1 /TAXON_ID=2966 /ORGANISM="Noctiluca scintillans" /LENGTH=63 /DNA_ID=CAMNT_0039355797 /DNA_START=286 /DNA_END=478 /DNA_ORIENTATION=+